MASALIEDLLYRVRVLGDEVVERGRTLGRYRAALQEIAESCDFCEREARAALSSTASVDGPQTPEKPS